MRPLDRNSTAGGRQASLGPGETLAAVLVERGDGPRRFGQGEPDREPWERRGGQHAPAGEYRGDGHAGGGQEVHQLVSGPSGDRFGDGVLELGSLPATFLEAEVTDWPKGERLTQARPEVLLVHDAQCDLPSVRRGEEAVPRDGGRSGLASGVFGR